MKYSRFLGISGLVLLVFGLIARFLLGNTTSDFVLVHLVVGVLLVILWIFLAGYTDLRSFISSLKGESDSAFRRTKTILFFSILVVLVLTLNVYVHRNEKIFDLTEQKVHTLSAKTEALLSALESPVVLTGISASNTKREVDIEKLLKRFSNHNPNLISVNIIHPEQEPELLVQYGFSKGDTIHLLLGSGKEKTSTIIKKVSEQSIVSALTRLKRKEGKVFYYLLGHGEPTPKSAGSFGIKSLVDKLQQRSITLKPLLLTLSGSVPEDAAGLAIISPEKKISEAEMKALLSYYERAESRVFLALDPRNESGILEFANTLGANVGEDIILDTIQTAHEAPKLGTQPYIMSYSGHPITRSFGAETMTQFNTATSVRPVAGTAAKSLFFSGKDSWAETDLTLLLDTIPPKALKGEGDIYGPVSMAVVSENDSRKSVVVGDTDWLRNSGTEVLYNSDLAFSIFDWLSGFDDEVLLPVRRIRASEAPISRDTFLLLLTMSFVIPEFFLLIGLFIWWKRKSA